MRHVAADETAGESDADPQILRGTRRKAASVGDLYHHCHHVSEQVLLGVFASLLSLVEKVMPEPRQCRAPICSNSQPTIRRSFSSHQSAFGCELTSPRLKRRVALDKGQRSAER
ncbi:hypothetical protein AB7M63_002803 [Bradyrhizobium japonicum]